MTAILFSGSPLSISFTNSHFTIAFNYIISQNYTILSAPLIAPQIRFAYIKGFEEDWSGSSTKSVSALFLKIITNSLSSFLNSLTLASAFKNILNAS